jgi:hypothetical protein
VHTSTSVQISWHPVSFAVLNSPFREGTAANHVSDSSTGGRRVITFTTETFEELYTVIYFLYTDELYISTTPDPLPEDFASAGIPNYLTAEQLYAVAHRLDIPIIKENTLEFLRHSWDYASLVDKAFSDFAHLYHEVWEMYREITCKNWEWIKKHEYFRTTMDDAIDRGNEESMREFERFWDLIKFIQENTRRG